MPQGLVPMLNTPSASATTLQTIGSVCWPFGNGASSRFGTCRLVLLVAAMSYQIMHSDTHFVFFAGTDLSQIPPPLPPGLLPDVKPSDFNAYKQAYASRLARFQSVRQSNFVPRIDSDDFVPGAQMNSYSSSAALHSFLLVASRHTVCVCTVCECLHEPQERFGWVQAARIMWLVRALCRQCDQFPRSSLLKTSLCRGLLPYSLEHVWTSGKHTKQRIFHLPGNQTQI